MKNKINLIEKKKKENSEVSCEQEVYSFSRNSLSSLVVNTSITDCSLKCGSSDQIGMLSLSANAKYCLSSGSDINDFAQFNCCGETLDFRLTNFDNISFILSNLSFEIFSNSQSSSECSSNSSKINLCEYKSKECFFANLLVNESFFSNENAMLASTTNFIYCSPEFFTNLSLTSLANLKQSLSVNLLFFVNSSSSLNNFALSSCIRTSCLASSDQFTQESCFISNFTFSGTENVTDGIYNSPLAFNLFNCSTLRIIMLLNTSDHLISGCLSNLSFNSFVIDNVTFAIFDLPLDYVNTQEDVQLYKSFDLQIIAFIFEIQNDGNCLLNISLNATDLWASIFGNSSYFQFKIDNKTGEEGSFNWTTSQTSWHYVPNSTEAAIFGFNWSDVTDSAEIDLLVTVPPQESAGDKSSTLHFTAELGE